MTRAHSKPVRRIVQTRHGEMVAELRADTLTLRPLRTRSGGPAEVVVAFGSIYLAAFAPKSRRRK